jgi:hypothetical protein
LLNHWLLTFYENYCIVILPTWSELYTIASKLVLCLRLLPVLVVKEIIMRTLRIAGAAVLLAVIFLGLVPPALAASVTHYTVRLENATIPWLFPLESFCSEIPEGVVVSPDDFGSDRVKQASLKELPDGTTRLVITDLVTGTATDNLGNTYRFVYQNVSTYVYDGSIVEVHMMDTFRLRGGDVNFTTGFNWSWAYEAASFGIVVSTDGGQTVNLDPNPFSFPPEVISGSWRQLSTRGDPFNCDPL